MKTASEPKVLFLCTGNACRSQMAEGFARRLVGDRFDIYSAGVEPHGMNPRAMQVMAEAGFPIDDQHSKHVNELGNVSFDYVVTVCGHADEACPSLPGPARRLHRGFDDPPKLARNAKTDEEAIVHYRRVRDDIHAYIRDRFVRDLEQRVA